MARRQYSDSDRDAALAFYDAARGNLSQAARLSDVPRQTLQRWVSQRESDIEAEKEAFEEEDTAEFAADRAPLSTAEYRAGRSKGEVLERWEKLRDRCFKELQVAFREASFRDLVTAAKAATDMVINLRGTYDDDDIEELLGEFVAAVKKFVPDEQTQAQISEELRRLARRRSEHA